MQNTRQSGLHRSAEQPLGRVLKSWHSAKILKFAECTDPALGKAATWRDPGRPVCRVPGADTRQHLVLCRVLKPWHSAKFQTFAECQELALGKAATWRHPGPALCRVPDADTRQSLKLCRVSAVRHSAKCRPRVPHGCFAECQGSRQSLCRVPEIRHSAKIPLPWEALPSGVCRV